MRRRTVGIGLALVAIYAVVLAATLAGHDGVRPLYDGFAPPARYRFVDPPPFFAAGNETPDGATATVALHRSGSAPVSLSTGDGQVSLNLAPGAIPAHGSDRHVRISITPEPSKGFGALPGGLRANGNVYRIGLRAEPSGTRITEVTRPGTLLVALPEVGQSFLRSASGQVWSPVDASTVPPRNLSVTTPFARAGLYVSGTHLPLLSAPPGEGSSSPPVAALVGAGVGIVALGLVIWAIVRRRRRRRPTAA